MRFRMAVRVIVLTGALVTAFWVAPTRPGMAGGPGPRTASWIGGAGDSLQGIWLSDQHPDLPVILQQAAPGVFHITCSWRFEAVGFGDDGPELVALVRRPNAVERAGVAWQPAVLRVRRLDATRLEARFGTDLKAAAGAAEVWRFRSGLGADLRLMPPPGGPGDSLLRAGGVVEVQELPEVIERVPPDYPDWAREKGVQGTVLVQALVGKDGLVKETRVANSVPDLDDYALGAVKQWRFKPARASGVPVAAWVMIPVRFTLR